jgi:hypothetical protein
MAKRGVGRPTEYGPDILTRAAKYLGSAWKDDGDVIPTIEGLSLYLDISRDTVYEWAKHDDKKEFSDIVERILSKQARTLANSGLAGKFNAPITKLMLSKHGYTEKSEVAHSGSISLTDLFNKASDAQ